MNNTMCSVAQSAALWYICFSCVCSWISVQKTREVSKEVWILKHPLFKLSFSVTFVQVKLKNNCKFISWNAQIQDLQDFVLWLHKPKVLTENELKIFESGNSVPFFLTEVSYHKFDRSSLFQLLLPSLTEKSNTNCRIWCRFLKHEGMYIFFRPSFLPSFLPSFPPSFLPSFLPSAPTPLLRLSPAGLGSAPARRIARSCRLRCFPSVPRFERWMRAWLCAGGFPRPPQRCPAAVLRLSAGCVRSALNEVCAARTARCIAAEAERRHRSQPFPRCRAAEVCAQTSPQPNYSSRLSG